MKTENLGKLMAESSLTVGNYQPTATFLSKPSVAVFSGRNALIATGWAGDQESEIIAQNLADSPNFKHLAKTLGYSDELKVEQHKEFPEERYYAICKSTPGKVESDGEEGDLLAVILDTRNPAGFAAACCISPEIEAIFEKR